MENQKETENNDSVVLEGIWSQGYGSVAKKVMRDRRLTRDARAIHAYLSSFAGAGSAPCPKVSTMCYDLCFGSEDTFYFHLNYLKAYGYLIVKHRKDEDRKILSNIYVIVNDPVENPEYLKKIEEFKEKTKKRNGKRNNPTPDNQGMDEKPTPDYRDTGNRDTDNQGTNNNHLNNNSVNNNKDQPVSQSFRQETRNEETTAGQTEIPLNENTIKKQVGYTALIQQHNSDLVNEMVLNVLDMYYSSGVKIKGELKPQAIVHSILGKLTHWHIQYVLDRFKEIDKTIKDKKSYLQSMIYTSVLEMGAHYENEVRTDQATWAEEDVS